MTDLAAVAHLASELSFAPDETKLEAFLQAYATLPEPRNLVEGAMYEVALQFAIDEFMELPCVCDHEHDDLQNS